MTDAPGKRGAPLANLDYEEIGRAAVMLIPICVTLRHASLDSTLRDYIHPEPLSASDFIRDLFIEPLDDVIKKWYGNRMNAGRIAAAVMDQVLDDLIPGGASAWIDRAANANSNS